MFEKFGRVTIILLLANFAMFTLQLLWGDWFTELFSLTPSVFFQGAYWQMFTYMFMHGGIMHIFLNMFVLLIFGMRVEETLGWKKYIVMYILAGLGSAWLYMLLTGFNSAVIMLGASGAVFGVLATYAFVYPKDIIWIFPGIPMPAIAAIVVFTVIELFSGIFGLEPGIANFGHLGGIIVGFIFVLIYKYDKKRKKKGGEEFKFVWE